MTESADSTETTMVASSNCPRCGRPAAARKGSFTAWIFAGSNCRCPQVGITLLAEAVTDTVSSGTIASEAAPPDTEAVMTAGNSLDRPAQLLNLDERYQLLDFVGQGGMGSVYKVRDVQLDKIFALKALHPEQANDRFALKRFKQEAEAAIDLTHPNLVAVYSHGISKDGAPYLVMDYIEGQSLADFLEREVYLDSPRVLDIAAQVCEALNHAHAKGIIHRDIKPSNILLTSTQDGQSLVKVIDFGIAKTLASIANLTIAEKTDTLTQTGEIFGSPQYMSPEQFTGEKLDQRSDIYSLGCVMYELLTGKAPFTDPNPINVILAHINEQPRFMSLEFPRLDIPAGVAAIVGRCLEKNAGDRYQTAEQLLLDIELARVGATPTAIASSTSLIINRLEAQDAWRRYAAAIFDASVAGSVGLFIALIWMPLAQTLRSGMLLPDTIFSNILALCLFEKGFVDHLLVSCLPIALVFLYHIVVTNHHANLTLVQEHMNFSALLILFNWLYCSCMESSEKKATLGKQLFGLRVESSSGQKLTFTQASVRHFAKIVSLCGVVDSFLVPVYVLCNQLLQTAPISWDDIAYRNPLHDRLAKACMVTAVQKQRPPLLANANKTANKTADKTMQEQSAFLRDIFITTTLFATVLIGVPSYVLTSLAGLLIITGLILSISSLTAQCMVAKGESTQHQLLLPASPLVHSFSRAGMRALIALILLATIAPAIAFKLNVSWFMSMAIGMLLLKYFYCGNWINVKKSLKHLGATKP